MGIQNVSHAHFQFHVVKSHLCREYPDGTKSGSDSDDEKDHSKDDLLESEFRKRRIKVIVM